MSVSSTMDDFNGARSILLETAARYITPALDGGGDLDAQATRMLLAFLAMGKEFNGGVAVDMNAVRQARFVGQDTLMQTTDVGHNLPSERVLTGLNVRVVMPYYYDHMVPVNSARSIIAMHDWIVHDTAFDTPILIGWADHTQQLRTSYFMTEKPVTVPVLMIPTITGTTRGRLP